MNELDMKNMVNKISDRSVSHILKEMDLGIVSIGDSMSMYEDPERENNPDFNPASEGTNVVSDKDQNLSDEEYSTFFDKQINIKHKKEWQKQSKFVEILELYLVGDINLNDAVANTILNLEGDTFIRDRSIEKLEFFIKELKNKWDLFDMSKYRNLQDK